MSFLSTPPVSPAAQLLFDSDVEELGYVMNASRLWSYQAETRARIFDLLREEIALCGLSMRERSIVVTAGVSALGDAYCSLAWGSRLAVASDADLAAGVLRGDDGGLTDRERALAHWARAVMRRPHETTESDVAALSAAGYTDEQIFGLTVFIALRLAFSTVNNALGARPDAQYRANAPAAVLDAVTYGRPISD